MVDTPVNYNPPGGAGIPTEESWETEGGRRTARPEDFQDEPLSERDRAGDDQARGSGVPLGGGKGSTGRAGDRDA
jgi:hypothetical protein